ncbi:MAG: UPF0262 family protein [Alphaproteobacteria bacterium]
MQKIIAVTLGENPKIHLKEQIEKERSTAIFDLISSNHFEPIGDFKGPFKLHLFKTENRIIFDIIDKNDTPLLTVPIGLSNFRNLIKDYFIVCESYFKFMPNTPCCQIDAIDMGRRSIHNEAAELLKQKLEGVIDIDEQTARALFTLVCVLHLDRF